eukprot:10525835-Heterocapsa_arctica.AAC.1
MLARASQFFESHMAVGAAASVNVKGASPSTRGSDLTEVLPKRCYEAFEDALDFIYSANNF